MGHDADTGTYSANSVNNYKKSTGDFKFIYSCNVMLLKLDAYAYRYRIRNIIIYMSMRLSKKTTHVPHYPGVMGVASSYSLTQTESSLPPSE